MDDLTPYVEATRKVGADEYITVIDLNALSVAMLKRMTQEEADKYNATTHPDAKAENTAATTPAAAGTPPDRTHLNAYGQKVFGRIVADQIVRTQVELGPDLIGEPSQTPVRRGPAGPPGSSPTPTPNQPGPTTLKPTMPTGGA